MRMAVATKLKGLLIDLNGTVHVGHEPTRNAVQAIEKLRASKFPFIFCSNNTKESSNSLLRKLKDMGINASPEEVMTSLGACRQLVEERGLKPFLLLSPSAREEFEHLPTSSPSEYDSVILGLHEESLNYSNLNKAFRILKNEPISPNHSSRLPNGTSKSRSPQLIAPHASMFQQSPATDDFPEGLSLGIGSFVRGLEMASGVEAELVGKPSRRFFELAIERMSKMYDIKLKSGEVGVIGDDVRNDLGDGPKEMGLRRILVRTGKFREEDEFSEDDPPDEVFDTLADAINKLV